MYNIIIADDEQTICKGLADFITNEFPEFNVCGVFEDGKDVLEYLQSNSVDCVITDIRMNEVDGITVAKYVCENFSNTKVLILSGYDDFKYAKAAITYKVERYLLKPVDLDELYIAIEFVKSQLDTQKLINDDYILSEYEQIFNDLINGELVSRNDIISVTQKVNSNIDIKSRTYEVIKGEVNNFQEYLNCKWQYGKDKLYIAIYNILKSQDENILYFYSNNKTDTLKFLVSTKTGIADRGYIYEALKESSTKIKEILNLTVDFELYKSYKDIFDLCENSSEAFGGKNEKFTPPEDDFIIKKAKKFIDENYNKDISLDDIADYVRLNPIYFSRFFKQSTGEKFIDYLINFRLEKAKKLLQTSKYKVYEIGDMVGYKNSKYFNRLFKHNTGVTPKEYSLMNNYKYE